MKRLSLLSFFFIGAIVITHAQKFASSSKGGLLGFAVNGTDFQTANQIKATSLGDVIKNKDFSSFRRLEPGFSLMYWKGLSKKIDFSIRYNGLFTNYSKNNTNSNNDYSNELEASVHARALSDDHLFNPFLSAGIGGGTYDGKVAPYAPLGVGIQANLSSITYLFLQANYRLSLDKARLDNNLFYSFGVTETISGAKAKLPVLAPIIPAIGGGGAATATVLVPKDSDNDGVIDSLDVCPDVAGLVKLNGCADKDYDGIADKDDKCPDAAGLAKFNGCPIPDADNDGINDEEDKCPKQPGVVKYLGCPIPDNDKDGINDDEDKCPEIAGITENNGCPAVKADVAKRIALIAKNVFFATNSAKILPKSFKSLNGVVAILKQNPDLKIDIEGHTDNAGKPEKNKDLSERRAKAVLDYLIKAGIDGAKITAAGYGDTQPIADNKTAKGKALNRRVIFKPKY